MATAFKDYYATLGVGKNAAQKEIRSAFRKLARRYHPDVNKDPAAVERFKEINEANEVLGDPAKRKTYDEVGPQWEQYQAWERAGKPGGGNPFAGGRHPFASHARTAPGDGGANYRTVTPEELESLFGNADPFSDFFHDLFGGGGATRQPQPRQRRGDDVEGEVTITLEEVYAGTTRTVEMKDGGRTRRIEVRIPPGVNDGARVRAAGQGAPGRGGGSAGDLFIRVHIAAHPLFRRDGNDVQTTVRVMVHVALLGGEVQIPTLKGTAVTLTIPPETQNGSRLRLRGQGLSDVRTGEKGDLIAEVNVWLPLPLTEEAKTGARALIPRS